MYPNHPTSVVSPSVPHGVRLDVRRVLWMLVVLTGARYGYGQEPLAESVTMPMLGVEQVPTPPAELAPPVRTLPLNGQAVQAQPLVLRLVLAVIPHEYENRKEWGGTREIWDGVRVRFDDGKLKTKRRKKTVNHGSWTRYRIELVEPEKNLRVDVQNVRALEEGKAAFDITVTAKLNVLGQFQEWNRGIKLLSVTTEAIADVRLVLSATLATEMDITRIPPDIVFLPEVTRAELQLADLKLRRVSHADGPLVREASWSVERILRDELRESQGKLVDKINRQIDKKSDSLRISSSRFVRQELLGLDEHGGDEVPSRD